MRVISGKYKGKRLVAPEGNGVRPTTDRIKETIFNILESKVGVRGAAVLDLFCGSGALGIEALSLGAKSAVFIDKSSESIRFTRRNLENIGVKIGNDARGSKRCLDAQSQSGEDEAVAVEVYNTGFEVALKKLAGRQFDLIFLDPPYSDGLEESCLFLIEKHNILDKDGMIVLECSAKNGFSVDAKKYDVDTRNFGSISASFITLRVVGD